MPSKKLLLKNCRLYVIIDRGAIGKRNIIKIAGAALSAGADIIQLRDKSSGARSFLLCAKEIKKLARKFKRPFIVNDRVDIARLADADGVHLGQDDLPLDLARRLMYKKIIGISAHTAAQAKDAEKKGADYIGIGPVFQSKTKKGLLPIGLAALGRVNRAVLIPSFAIGGISLDNIADVKNTGAERVALASSAVNAKDVGRAVKKIKSALLKG